MALSSDFSQRVRQCADHLASSGVDALGGLFDLASDRLVRLAIAITRNQHDAEDAVQSALVRMAGRPKLLADAIAPWPYLLQIVRNEALAIARKKKRLAASGNLADLTIDRRVDELEQEEIHRAVWAALRTLPPEQAEVVVLKIWEALTFAEIGQILGASPNTVASRYQYAMAKLSRQLTPGRQEARRV